MSGHKPGLRNDDKNHIIMQLFLLLVLLFVLMYTMTIFEQKLRLLIISTRGIITIEVLTNGFEKKMCYFLRIQRTPFNAGFGLN